MERHVHVGTYILLHCYMHMHIKQGGGEGGRTRSAYQVPWATEQRTLPLGNLPQVLLVTWVIKAPWLGPKHTSLDNFEHEDVPKYDI